MDLVKAALEKAAEESSRDGAEFVLYSGDYQRHSVERVTDDLWGTFESVVVTVRDLFSETFGNGKVHMVPTILMGNNDFIPDYFVNGEPQSLPINICPITSNLLHNRGLLSYLPSYVNTPSFPLACPLAFVWHRSELRLALLV